MRLIVSVVALAALLSGCGGSKLEGLPDEELAEKYGQCLDKQPTAPGRVQACENMRRECERRRTELGKYVCRSY